MHGDNVGSSNREFYDNDEVDEFLNQAKLSIDQDERASFYQQAQELIADDAPMVPLVHSRPVLATTNAVENYVPHPSTSESLAEVELAN